ncbi:MAG: anti-sigma factor antagonist [Syntrophomonadaceae bacterium]|nr:anti-sigma factor antagonist [Syntrophomonadaceae bacterium]
MSYDIKNIKNGVMVRIRGELDLMTAGRLRPVLEQILRERPPTRMVFDLEHTTFIDSSGLALILGRYRQISEQGGRMFIVGVRPMVHRILDLSGVVGLIPILPTANDVPED